MQLIEHIEVLLSEYPCLSIPGFGGFVVQEIDAHFIEETLYPPCMEVTFNRDLSHNDGLLVSQVARIKGYNTTKAIAWIKEEVQLYHTNLLKNSTLSFGHLGQLSVNSEGGILFQYNKENHLFPKFFGMRPVKLLPICKAAPVSEPKLTQKTEAQTTVVLEFPRIERGYIKYIASAAAVFLLFFLSTPSLFDSRSPQTASMFFDSFKFVTNTSNHLIEQIIPKEIPEEELIPLTEPVKPAPAAEFIEEGHFCVVVLSCTTLESAKTEIAKRKAILDTATIVEGNGRFRVVVMQTNNRSRANECLNYYKAKGLSDTWLHTTQ